MKCILLGILLIAGTSATQVTPVQKVIQLMQGMLEKGKKEKHDEQVQFAAYKEFCDDTTVEKERAIAEANEMIDMLKADIAKYTAHAAKLGKEIAALEEEIAVKTGDIKAATKVREIEKAQYSKTHADYDNNVVEIEAAIEVEEKELAAHGSFLQLSDAKSLIPEGATDKINAFLSTDYGLTVEQPEADSYESHSGGILDTFEKLDKKFIDERTNLEKQEMNSQHEFEMLMQDLNAQITEDTKNRDKKAESKAAKLQAKATAEGDLAETTATRDADSKYLKDLTATCQEKAKAFESRQKLR